LLGTGSDIVQRDDHKISASNGGWNEGQKVRCRNGTHLGIFGRDTALNKAKSNAVSSSEVEEPRDKNKE